MAGAGAHANLFAHAIVAYAGSTMMQSGWKFPNYGSWHIGFLSALQELLAVPAAVISPAPVACYELECERRLLSVPN